MTSFNSALCMQTKENGILKNIQELSYNLDQTDKRSAIGCLFKTNQCFIILLLSRGRWKKLHNMEFHDVYPQQILFGW
jgi:hypothetical protein